MLKGNGIKAFFALVVALGLAGCAAAPTYEQQAAADYGREMTAEECTALAEQAISSALKDPESARFRHNPCIKGYWSSVPIMGMPIAYGYFQQGEVNAKNSYGGYVGFKTYQILMHNGSVVRYCIADNDGICMPIGR